MRWAGGGRGGLKNVNLGGAWAPPWVTGASRGRQLGQSRKVARGRGAGAPHKQRLAGKGVLRCAV
jgi:hypothetical protein